MMGDTAAAVSEAVTLVVADLDVVAPAEASVNVNRITINVAADFEEEDRPLVQVPVPPMKDDLVLDVIALEIVVFVGN